MRPLLALVVLLFAAALAYPNMPGDCTTTGGVMSAPSQANGGFTINGVPQNYNPGQAYQITVQGNKAFRGLLLYAKSAWTNSTYRGGAFTAGGNTQLMNNCNNQQEGATLGHTQQLRDNPQTSVQVTWTAPDPPVGPLSFRGIVVVSVQESYTLTPVTSQGDGAPPPEPVGPTDQTPAAAASMLVNVVLMMALLLVLMA